MCERLQAQVEQLLKREKWLTDRNHELGQKLCSLYLARTTIHNGHYELIQEEEEEPHSLAFNCQRRVHVANMTIEHVEEQMIQKEKEFEQAIQIEKNQHLMLQNKCAREAQLQKMGADEVVKNLMEEVNDLRSANKTLVTANIEIKNKRADAYKQLDAYKSQYDSEKMSLADYRKHIEDKLMTKVEHRISREVFLSTAVLKKKINELKDKNTELSNQLRKGQGLQADTLSELDRVKLRFNEQVIRLTVQEKSLISSHEIQTELKENASKFTNIIDSKCLKIAHLTNLVTELEEKNNDVNARRESLHQKWKKALTKGSEQAAMIQELQDDIRLKAGKNNALVKEQVVVKEQHHDLSNQLINVKWQLVESRKALDVCSTSAVNERALGEKKMAAEKEKLEKLEELEEELQRHKELLEEGNEQIEKLQVENEQLRRKRNLMKFVVLPHKTPPPLIPKHPQSRSEDMQKLKHTCFPPLKKSTIQPKETSQAHPASSNLLPLRKRQQMAPSPTQISSQTPSKVDQKIEKSVRWELPKNVRVLNVCVISNEPPLGKKKMAEVEPLHFSPVPPTCRAQPASSNLLASRKRKVGAQPHPISSDVDQKTKCIPLPSILRSK